MTTFGKRRTDALDISGEKRNVNEVQRLIEQRQIRAAANKWSIKLTLIATRLGTPIMAEYDLGVVTDPDQLDTYGDDDSSRMIGHLYDSLHLGRNLEVRLMDGGRNIRACWEGRLVYEEDEGALTTYVPQDEWEEFVNYLYQVAQKRDTTAQEREREARRSALGEKADRVIQKLKDLWGI
jgi:hypothetical protein